MLIDKVIISLTRVGAGSGPDYNLIIYGTGKVVFQGNDKVARPGEAVKYIEDSKVVDLLSDFKTTNFFSFNERYDVTDPIGKTYSKISITLPKDSGNTVTKSVTFYQSDLKVPAAIKALEEKILKIADVDDWINIKPPTPQISKRPVKKPPNKKKKLFLSLGLISIMAVAIILLYLFLFGPNIVNDNPTENLSISYLTSASYVSSNGDYFSQDDFEQGENVYIYLEYENVTVINENSCNIEYHLTVTKGSKTYYSTTQKVTDLDNYLKFFFVTNNSWDEGSYLVTVDLMDNPSKESTRQETNFYLNEKTLRIVELLTATDIQGIGQYNESSFFNQSDKIWVYHQYEGFGTYSNGSCDLYLELNIREINGQKNYTTTAHEYNPDNIARRWWFTTDQTWPKATYYVIAYMTDNLSKETTSDTTAFILK